MQHELTRDIGTSKMSMYNWVNMRKQTFRCLSILSDILSERFEQHTTDPWRQTELQQIMASYTNVTITNNKSDFGQLTRYERNMFNLLIQQICNFPEYVLEF